VAYKYKRYLNKSEKRRNPCWKKKGVLRALAVSSEREKDGVLKSWIDTHKSLNFITRGSERLRSLLALG